MNVVVELNAGQCTVYDRALLTRVTQKTIESSGCIGDYAGTITVSVAFVEACDIQRINREFRGKNRVTDVISVGDYSDDRDIACEQSDDIFLGEIILCYTYITASAQQRHVEVDQEFFTVYSHGILHLLGFKHGKKMYNLQEKISDDFTVKSRAVI